MRRILCAILFVVAFAGIARAEPKPLVLTVHQLTAAEHEALSALLARVLTNVLGADITKLVTAKVRYHYEGDSNPAAVVCESYDIDVPLPGAIYKHQWHGVEELFGTNLALEATSTMFIGRALPSDTLVFVRLVGPPVIKFVTVVGGTLITIAPGQVLVYREYTEA